MIIEQTSNNFLRVKSSYVEELLNGNSSTLLSLTAKVNNGNNYTKEFLKQDFWSVNLKNEEDSQDSVSSIKMTNLLSLESFTIPCNLFIGEDDFDFDMRDKINNYFIDNSIISSCTITYINNLLSIRGLPNNFIPEEINFNDSSKNINYGIYEDVFIKDYDLYIKPSFFGVTTLTEGIYKINLILSDGSIYTTEESCIFVDITVKERLSRNLKSLLEEAYYLGNKQNFGLHVILLHYALNIGNNSKSDYLDLVSIYSELLSELAIIENNKTS